MSSMLDRGDSHVVWYLGCTMLHQGATGVGVLQKPLREMYFAHRKAGEKASSLQERYLVISSAGLTSSHQEGARTLEVTYSMTDILLWDAVQFITVKDKKKMNCAFEPLDNDHSRCKDNLYVPLEKKWLWLASLTHPALVCLVLRRPGRVKALDVHVLVCRGVDEALGLVRALNHAHARHHHLQGADTGLFGYNPFKDVPAGGSRLGLSTPGVPAVTRHSSLSSLLDPPKQQSLVVASPDGVSRQGDGGDGNRSNLGLSSKQLSASRVCLLTQEYFTPAKPKDVIERSTSLEPQCTTLDSTTRSNSLDNSTPRLQSTNDTAYDSSSRGPNRLKETRQDSKESDRSTEHAYQYLSHIDNSLGRDSGRGSQDQLTSPTNSLGSGQQASLASVVVGSLASSPHSRGQDSGFNSAVDTAEESSTRGSTKSGSGKDRKKGKDKSSKKDSKKEKKDKKTDSRDKKDKDKKSLKEKSKSLDNLLQDEEVQEITPKKGKILVKVLPTPATPSSEEASNSKLGEGYSLLSGSAGPPPGHLPPRRRYVDSPEYQRPYIGPPGSPPGHQRPMQQEQDLDYDYDVDIANLAMFDARPDPMSHRRSKSPSTSHRSVQSTRSGHTSRQQREVPSPTYDHIPIHQLRPPKDPGYLAQPPKLPSRQRSESGGQSDYASSHGDVRSVYREADTPNLRPVAMVPPHKVTGVRVLPQHKDDHSPQKPQRPRSIFDSPEDEYGGINRRSQSQFFMDQLERNYASENEYTEYSPTKSKYEDNWQFKASVRGGGKEYKSDAPPPLPPPPPNKGKQKPEQMGEKLLMNQKKDAEIASVMQNIKFGYRPDSRTLTPGAPGGMNFERSLGYFP